MAQRTVAQIVARVCANHGVRRAYGVPGGGSSLDLIAAFAERDITFTLMRTEAGAAMAAAASAEAGDAFGVVIATQGPGTASVVNGIAHASLDRCKVILITDGWTTAQQGFDTHQVFDQQAMLAPVVRGSERLDGPDPALDLETLLARAATPPWGPVYIELTGETARRLADDSEAPAPSQVAAPLDPDRVGAARAMIGAARRPVLLVGLEVRESGSGARLAALAEALGAPVLTTYKAKGVLPDGHPNLVGLFTGGAAERDCVGSADLIVLCGFDPVELIGRPWPYTVPVLDLGPVRHPVHYVKPACHVRGSVPAALDAIGTGFAVARWEPGEIMRLRQAMLTRLAYGKGGEGLSPEDVVRLADIASRGLDPRATVDAGAMMFSAMAFWPVNRSGDILISNGLASMAYAVPAGMALSIETPQRPVFAFTGDGGMMMGAGELSSVAQHAGRLVIVVFNDAALSLIAIKQTARQLPRAGVTLPRPDFSAVARGFGLRGYLARDLEEYQAALTQALAGDGPALIDVHVDPSGYLAQSVALRG
ncbi:MAG TPA: thiamine pyrophosphate-dependent enzyme [Rhodopila sp.]|nr:thiamine pyrophosphate-dependent enzyme [Rhodopila sp.]